MSVRRPALLLAVACVCLISFPKHFAVDADDWLPIDPAELKMTSEPKAPGAAAIYLYRQVDRKDLGRANVEHNYVRIKILTEEGRKFANVEIPFSHSMMGISSLRARTIHSDGTIVNFDGKTYDQTIEKTRGTKYVAKTFTMPDVQVGSIIEYRYTLDLEDGWVFASRWILSEDLFTKKASFSLVPYQKLYLKWSWNGLPPNTDPPKQDPLSVVHMTAQDIPAFQAEEYMPPENELKLRVDFVYSEEMFDSDSDKYWKHYGKKQSDRVEGFVGKRKAMEGDLAGIISPTDSPDLKLRKIYARCQQVRNLSYETRKTDQETKREVRPNQNVEDVWKNGYGHGSEITWLFLALARAAGFDASPVIVSQRGEYFFNPNRMNSTELNSNVVLVKLDGKDQFFDPGSAFAPYGLLPWQESGVTGRKLDHDGGSWVQTELTPSSLSKIVRKADLKLNDQGSLEGKVTVSYFGLEALNQRIDHRHDDDTDRKKYLEDRLREYIPSAAEVELKSQPDWKGPDAPLVAEYDVKIDGWVSGAGHRALLPVGLFSATEKHAFEHTNRVQPVYFHFLYTNEDDITIELPAGWQVTSMPQALDKDAKAARYTLTVVKDKNSVHIARTLKSDVSLVPKDVYPALRGFYSIVRTCDDEQVVLQPGATSAGN